MKQQYFDKFIVLLMVLLIASAVFLQIYIAKSTDKLKNNEIEKSEQYAQQIAKLIQLRTNNNIEETLTHNPQLQKYLNESLHAFLTRQYRYIFILQKDKKNKYRFLLDASTEEPEEYKAIFFPKSKLFDSVYDTGELQIVLQHDGVEEVWVSLLYPILNEGKTEALLVLDLSETYGAYLDSFHSPLMNAVFMMQFFLVFSLSLLLFLAYKYYKARQELIHDRLTSVYTKHYLIEFFNENSVDKYHAILIDIDEFKLINKKYGEKVGNTVIKMFTTTIVTALSGKSKVIRVGGTEFLVIIPKEEGNIELLANNLFTTLQVKKYTIDNEEIHLNVSMSAMSMLEGMKSIQSAQRLLDEKLLEVKSRGKNAVGILGINHLDDVKYSNVDYIKEALDEERLLCLYQPIYRTKTKQIVKYEALVRLIDKEDPKKLISPFHFMDIIKGTSQYIKMSKLVFNHVFKTLVKYPDIELSVNIDLDDLYNADMMNLITKNLYLHKEIANRLTFEILEASEVKDYKRVQFIFQQLKAFGSKVAIDDFGSGYANYNYLIKLNVDILKIDGSLIRELQDNQIRAKIVLKSIQRLAATFDYELVAEFVSHKDIYDILKDLDIEYSQGYYLGEPRPINRYIR